MLPFSVEPDVDSVDLGLNAVFDWFRQQDPDGLRMAKVFRETFDQLYDGQRTGRGLPNVFGSARCFAAARKNFPPRRYRACLDPPHGASQTGDPEQVNVLLGPELRAPIAGLPPVSLTQRPKSLPGVPD